VLLLGSGSTALVYETLWVKQLGRVVGVEVHAVTIALSAFFAGLAVGSALLGRLADRSTRPIRLYAVGIRRTPTTGGSSGAGPEHSGVESW
jgi:MFS family permease